MIQGGQEWHLLRRGVPTSSNFNRILTPRGKVSKQMDGLIAELIGDLSSPHFPERAESYTSRAMRWGQETEEEARRFYCLEKNCDVTNGGFCLSDDGRFGASPDSLVGVDGLLEIKCPLPKTQVEYLMKGTLPAEYLEQCHGELIVTGRSYVDFLSYATGLAPLIVRVTPDEYTLKLRAALEMFWYRFQALKKKLGVLA